MLLLCIDQPPQEPNVVPLLLLQLQLIPLQLLLLIRLSLLYISPCRHRYMIPCPPVVLHPHLSFML
jgi:hypothetical protein